MKETAKNGKTNLTLFCGVSSNALLCVVFSHFVAIN